MEFKPNILPGNIIYPNKHDTEKVFDVLSFLSVESLIPADPERCNDSVNRPTNL